MRWSYLFFLLLCVLWENELKAIKPIQERRFVIDKILRGHSAGVQNLRFSPDGKWIASASIDKTIIIWDVKTGILRHRLYGHRATIYEVTFNEKGNLLASASEDGTVCLWDARYGKLLGRYENKALLVGGGLILRSVSFVTFSKDDKYIYFGGDNGYIMRARIDIPNQLATPIFNINLESDLLSNTITGGTIASNASELIFSVDHFVYAISLKNHQLIKRFYNPDAEINDVVKGATSRQITAWAYDGTVITWDYFTTKKITSLKVAPNENYSAASFNKDKTLLVTGADGRVANIWNWATKKRLARLGPHYGIVRVARFSPTEEIIATASLDGWVRIWKEDTTLESPIIVQGNSPLDTDKDQNTTTLDETIVQNHSTTSTKQNISTKELNEKMACDTVFIEKEKIVYIRDTLVIHDTIVEKIVVRDTIKVVQQLGATTALAHQDKTTTPDQGELQNQLQGAYQNESESRFKVGQVLNLHAIQFEQGSATLLEESYKELERLYEILKKHPTMKIRLDGHTDNVGVQTANLRLSGLRVRMVQDYLVRKGIARNRIQIRAHGGRYPIADNSTEEGRRKNRRVEVTVLER